MSAPGDLKNERRTDRPLPIKRNTREQVFERLDNERDYQDNKWGPVVRHQHELPTWLAIMKRCIKKAEDAYFECGSDSPMFAMDEIRQAVATGIACLEQHGCPKRHVPFSDCSE